MLMPCKVVCWRVIFKSRGIFDSIFSTCLDNFWTSLVFRVADLFPTSWCTTMTMYKSMQTTVILYVIINGSGSFLKEILDEKEWHPIVITRDLLW